MKFSFLSGLAMNKAVTRVCKNKWSGSDDSVFLKFKSTKREKNETFTCRTKILDTGFIGAWVDDWSSGSTQTWGHWVFPSSINHGASDHNFLGECAKDFRPYDKLEFKVIIARPNVIFDDVEICKLTVTFGKNYPKQEGSSQWVWGGDWWGAWTYQPDMAIDNWQIGNGPKQKDTRQGETNWLLLQKM